MRLWHYKLIPHLPDPQLVAQWRELGSIFANRPNHILINYVYEYPDDNLRIYADYVYAEMLKRGFRVRTENYFLKFNLFPYPQESIDANPFPKHHDFYYLRQCFYNLQEKFMRGQKGFPEYRYDELNMLFAAEECEHKEMVKNLLSNVFDEIKSKIKELH